MALDPFLAIDWGTTNRRVFRIDNGEVEETFRDGAGVTTVSDFAQEVTAIRKRFGDLPVVAAGMVGSTLGWHEVPYVPAPADLHDIARGLHYVDARTAIVPGVSVLDSGTGEARRGDIMRGEETQLLGAAAAGLVPGDAVLAQPGTHCKWARLTDGRLTDFTTAMSGELFALVRQYSLLAPQLWAEVNPGGAFEDGVAEGARRDLASSLFGVRAAKLLGLRNDEDAASYASGVIIGADVAARIEAMQFDCVYVLADAHLGGLYAAAIRALGRDVAIVDSHAAFVAGIIRIRDAMT